MNPEFEKKILKEYLEIAEDPDGKSKTYGRIKIFLYILGALFMLVVWASYKYCLISHIYQIFGAGFAGAFLVAAGMTGYSQAQGPLISKYMETEKIKQRLADLNA